MDPHIAHVIKQYEIALNTGSTEAALALYGREPIFMPQHSPALIGRDAVKAGYDFVFENLRLNVTFTIHEIVTLDGDLAYVRTTSSGTTELLKAAKTVREANNELFIFRREDETWKIHRYLFATSNPPPAA